MPAFNFIRSFLCCLAALCLFFAPPANAEDTPLVKIEKTDKLGFFKTQNSDVPTYIKSDNLTLRSEEQVFVYTGNVEVKQGDMTLTAEILEGKYDENNEIKELVAKNNVVIIKGDGLRATSQRAVYEGATETLVLTENPELQQKGSVLTADTIRLLLAQDKSFAEGAVRVKLVDEEKAAKQRKRKGLAEGEGELGDFVAEPTPDPLAVEGAQ